MKTYRVYRIHQTGTSAEPEFVDVPAISQEHAISVAMAECFWTSSEIKCADERPGINWTGPLWYVIDPDHNLVEREDKSLVAFALKDEARKYISALSGKGYDIQKISARRVQNGLWPRKKLDI